MSGTILGMGNPLLDIAAKVDAAFLEKYGLQPANQILAEEKHLPMYEELAARPDVQYIPGGATQNSIRVAQWMLQQPGATAYMGCVGKDAYADKMRAVCSADGVNVRYMEDEATPTGTCAVCVVDSDRSLVANLAAANNYKVEHLKAPENFALLQQAKIIYSAGFFITVSPESIMTCAEHALANNQIYCMNISAPFIVEVPPFKAVLSQVLPMVDYLFGNETEAVAFAKSEGWETTVIAEIALKIHQRPGSKPLTVVITQGKDAVVVARDGAVEFYDVPAVDPARIVDTNGAGDAFVGGFLAALLRGDTMAACCAAGNYAASVIIQTTSTILPAECTYKFMSERIAALENA